MDYHDNDDKLFGHIAILKEFIDSSSVAEALDRQLSDMAGKPIGEILMALDMITDEQVAEVLAEQERLQAE